MPDSSEVTGRAQQWRGYLLAAFAAACWATGGLMAKWLFSPVDAVSSAWPVPPPGIEADPVVLAGTRALFAAALLLIYVGLTRPGVLRVRPRDLPFLVVFGAGALAGVHVAYFLAISYTNVATAILLEYLAPVIVLVLSVAFLGEQFTWNLPVGVALSIAGCALVVGAFGPSGIVVAPAGIVWGLAAAGFFALYQLLGKWAAPRFSPWTLLTYGLVFASAFWLLYLRGFSAMADLLSTPTGLGSLAYIAVVATIVPFAASLKALHYIDATKAVVTSTLEPVLAGVAGWLLFGETFDVWQMTGGLLVLMAIIVVQRANRRTALVPLGP